MACCHRSPHTQNPLQIRVLLDLQNNFFVRIAILSLNKAGTHGQLERLCHIVGSRRKQASILCFDLVPRKELCLLPPAVVFQQAHAHCRIDTYTFPPCASFLPAICCFPCTYYSTDWQKCLVSQCFLGWLVDIIYRQWTYPGKDCQM